MSASFHLWTLHVQEGHEVNKAESYLWAHMSSLLTHSTTELWPISSRDQTLALGMAPYLQDTRVPLDDNHSRSLRSWRSQQSLTLATMILLCFYGRLVSFDVMSIQYLTDTEGKFQGRWGAISSSDTSNSSTDPKVTTTPFQILTLVY